MDLEEAQQSNGLRKTIENHSADSRSLPNVL